MPLNKFHESRAIPMESAAGKASSSVPDQVETPRQITLR
jgi:hypothetical protein